MTFQDLQAALLEVKEGRASGLPSHTLEFLHALGYTLGNQADPCGILLTERGRRILTSSPSAFVVAAMLWWNEDDWHTMLTYKCPRPRFDIVH